MTAPTELSAIGIDCSRSVYVRNADGTWPTVPTRVEPPAIPTLATVAAANDEGVAELRDLEAKATRGEWSVAEGSVEDGSIYIDADDTGDRPVAMIMSGSPHNQDRADAAFIVAAVAFARAAIRLLSQGGGK